MLGVATLTALLCESVIFISLSETVCACVTGGLETQRSLTINNKCSSTAT